MTETKRERRAAAVERLRELDSRSHYDIWDVVCSATNVSVDVVTTKEGKRLLIDLLTDDEQPEGDAVAILRKAARCTSINTSIGDVLRYNVPGNGCSAWQTAEDACESLADMIERDYVRREYHCKTVDDNAKLFAKVLDERDELRSSLDTAKALVEAYKADNAELRRVIDELSQPTTEHVDNGPQPDTIKSPAHYTQGGIECKDAIKAALTDEEYRGWVKASAIAYIWRERHKGGMQDLEKAHEMLGWLVDDCGGIRVDYAPLIVGRCAACSSLIFAGDNFCAKCGAKAAIVCDVDNCGGDDQ